MCAFPTLVALSLWALAGVRAEESSPAQAKTPEADLLSDSELSFEVSGGIAGVVRAAKLVAKAGEVTAEYSSSGGGSPVPRQTATLEPSRYLMLWEEAEGDGIWAIANPGKETGADRMRHELRARVGKRHHFISWIDGEASPPSARSGFHIGERILAIAREATTER